ncbi:MAG: peptidase S41 [Pseudomonadota bacterium]
MSLAQDLEQILEIALSNDPSFRELEKAAVDACIDDARRSALEGSTESFLLSAMRLMALPGNGHTRLIPNDAISVLPLRFVSIGTTVNLTEAAAGITPSKGELMAVNGAPLSQIEAAAGKLLAGTHQRKRVIGPILFAWPHALTRLGFPSRDETTVYRLRDEHGLISDLDVQNGHRVQASTLYPRNEHGRADPNWEPGNFVEIRDWDELGVSIALPSFFDPGGDALHKAISMAAERIKACPNTPLLIDVRGNTGGDFLQTMPLINAIAGGTGRQVVALVDKFTFSAAIVFVALLKHRLGGRLKLIGEEMGDGLTFFAEGGLIDLPTSGAVVRYSTAFHDWRNGTSDETTPPEIARYLVPAGALEVDREWIGGANCSDGQDTFHQSVLKSLNN